MAPTALPALADEAALAERWRDIAIILRRQYDANWAAADGTHFFNSVRSYKVISITADEIAVHLDYMAQDNMRGTSANGFPQLRQAEVRFRNRTPDFRVLQWGNLPPLGPEDDAALSRVVFRNAEEARQFSPILRRALERQYAATVRFWPAEAISTADSGPPDGMHVKRHEVTALQSGQLTIAVTYEVATGGTGRRDREATVTLRNEGPAFEVLDWQRQ
jgi:hypothetical protein